MRPEASPFLSTDLQSASAAPQNRLTSTEDSGPTPS